MDILTDYQAVSINGHEIRVPVGTEIFQTSSKFVILHKFGSVFITMKEQFVETEVNYHDGYKALFLFNQQDKALFEFGYKTLNILFNQRVNVTKKLRNMQTQSIKLHLLPLDPSDPEYNDGRKYYTVDEQRIHRNAGKPKESQAKRENNKDVKEDQFNIFETVDADISMEAAFSVM
jgi:hypothetical protein